MVTGMLSSRNRVLVADDLAGIQHVLDNRINVFTTDQVDPFRERQRGL